MSIRIDKYGHIIRDDVEQQGNTSTNQAVNNYNQNNYSQNNNYYQQETFDYAAIERRKQMTRAAICIGIAVVLEIAFTVIGFSTGLFLKAIRDNIGTYILLQVILLANAGFGWIFAKIGGNPAPSYIASIVSVVITWYSFIMSVFFGDGPSQGFLENIFTGILAFLFFGAISAGVSYLCSLFFKK